MQYNNTHTTTHYNKYVYLQELDLEVVQYLVISSTTLRQASLSRGCSVLVHTYIGVAVVICTSTLVLYTMILVLRRH